MTKEKQEKNEAQKNETKCLLTKINAIRKAWADTKTEKEGQGKAGGGAKYDYYKPQQIIDFCLAQELKHNLFSEFKIMGDMCFYNVVDIYTKEERTVECPFDVPRTMAASAAQQIGAAMTYHSRRLAMMMYKIDDNSIESNKVLDDPCGAENTIPAPVIPPPLINIAPESVDIKEVESNIQPEAPSEPVSDSSIEDEQIQQEQPDVVKAPLPYPPAKEIKEPKMVPPPIATPNPVPYINPSEITSKKDDIVKPTPPQINKKNIEDLYN